ncbi:MAG: CBS domain-containing protein [Gammaproteobacteria bacterium]
MEKEPHDQATTRARDLMVPTEKYPSAAADCSLREAARLLSDWHIDMHGSVSMPRILLLIDHDGQLVSMVRRRDILRGLAPSFLVASFSDHPEAMFDVDVDPNLTELLSGRAEEKLRLKAEMPVSEIAHPIPAMVTADDPLIRVIQIMVRHDLSMVPVLDDGKVIGVVRTVEVLKEVSRSLADADDPS